MADIALREAAYPSPVAAFWNHGAVKSRPSARSASVPVYCLWVSVKEEELW